MSFATEVTVGFDKLIAIGIFDVITAITVVAADTIVATDIESEQIALVCGKIVHVFNISLR